MQVVHGPDATTTNLLNLGPIHDKVMDHCCKIINDPDLLLSPSVSYATGTLDGKGWDNLKAIYAIMRYAPTLLHLQEALIMFFEGALETWV